MLGKKMWVIPDGYVSSDNSARVICESVCVLNIGSVDAQISITIYFEDKPPLAGFKAVCAAQRSHHIRLDKLQNDECQRIPMDTPYSIVVESSCEIFVQHSRIDIANAQTLMTTTAYG